jgi:hypothetical protein
MAHHPGPMIARVELAVEEPLAESSPLLGNGMC